MVNILLGGNRKVFGDTLILVASMADKTEEALNITYLTIHIPQFEPKGLPLTKEHARFLDSLVKKKNPTSRFKLVDATEQFCAAGLTSGKNFPGHFSPYSNIRLIADKILGLPDRVIYLDNDIILNGDIKEFWDFNIEKYEVGVVKDDFRPFWSKYYNAGVMLMNLKRIRASKMFERVIHMNRTRKLMYPNQTPLNRFTRKTKRMLPRKFNAKSKYYPEIVIHHICNVREGRFFLIGKWWHRIKPSETELLRKKLPAYIKYFDLLDQTRIARPELF